MSKRILTLVLCIIMMFSSGVVAQASVEELNNRSVTYYTNLYISNGTANCFSMMNVSDSVTKVVVTMTLQSKTLWWWSTEETWTSTQYSNSISLSKSTSVTSDTYRIKTDFEIYTGTTVETITLYSSEVTC